LFSPVELIHTIKLVFAASAKHEVLWDNINDWMTQNKEDVSE
jgi:hypothetical protein